MPSDTNDIWAQALQEAYASAPSNDVILHTLELRHPSFVDRSGIATPVRVVADPGVLLRTEPDGLEIWGFSLGLEEGAPLNSGHMVDFVSCMFDLSLPEQRQGSLPTVEVSLDNVSQEIMPKLEATVGLRAPIELTYREYLASEPSFPQFVLGGLSIKQVKSNQLRVTGTAQFADLINRNFPGKVYRPSEFRGLSS